MLLCPSFDPLFQLSLKLVGSDPWNFDEKNLEETATEMPRWV